MRKITLLLLITLCAACTKAHTAQPPVLLPHCSTNTTEVVRHTYITLGYAEAHEQPQWVYYLLSPSMIEAGTSRTNDFRADSKVRSGSATLEDYKGSGYDRGHLCPAGSMTHNRTAMSESFLLSNMSPQQPGFNRGVWKRLEEAVRDLVVKNGEMYVVSGPIFNDNQGTIGANEVTIPGFYYKAIYSPALGQMFAFVVPHQSSSADLKSFCVTVDALEAMTGVDFFADLEPQLEAKLESTLSIPSI